MLDLIQLWTGPLPLEHIWIKPENRPKDLYQILRVYFRKWFLHPIKRKIAKYYLWLLQAFCNLKVIAITGSAGKTTTKELLLGILSQDGETIASYGNIDPIYNIPTTILRCTPKTKYLILEMGIEFIGEMTFYTWLAQPDIAIITNVNLTHTEFLKDIKTVGYEKGLIGKNATTALIITDDPNIQINTTAPIYKVQAKSAKLTKNFTTIVDGIELPIIGTHLAQNISLAVQTAKLLAVDDKKIKTGLTQFKNAPHRLQVVKTKKHGTLIDDSYNANPLAVKASISTLIELSKLTKLKPVLVLSQMNELGSHEQSAHQELAKLVKNYQTFTIGPATKNIGKHFEKQEDLITELKRVLDKNNLTLIKGSRGWKLENVVAALID